MTSTLPGRLGNPDLTLATDPRADPRMVAAMAPAGAGARPAPMTLTVDSPLDALHEMVRLQERGMAATSGTPLASQPEVAGVSRSVEVIPGLDGNRVELIIHRPTAAPGPLPCVLHLHGGGMAMFRASDPDFVRWRDDLAADGLVVIGVEFRNASGALGPHPFPAGLRDCAAALQWVAAHRHGLGISGIVVSGESGGANLALATAILARREGRVDQIDGVFAQCPYVSNAYAEARAPGGPPSGLASLVENDGYFVATDNMALLAHLYDPGGAHRTDPLAWPLHATLDDLRGLPPHLITVNELDPLRDEGLLYYRKLLAAGVAAVGRVLTGTCHAGDRIFWRAMPDVYAASRRDVHGFAVAVAGN